MCKFSQMHISGRPPRILARPYIHCNADNRHDSSSSRNFDKIGLHVARKINHDSLRKSTMNSEFNVMNEFNEFNVINCLHYICNVVGFCNKQVFRESLSNPHPRGPDRGLFFVRPLPFEQSSMVRTARDGSPSQRNSVGSFRHAKFTTKASNRKLWQNEKRPLVLWAMRIVFFRVA